MTKMTFEQHGNKFTIEWSDELVNIHAFLEMCHDLAVGSSFHTDSFDQAIVDWYHSHNLGKEE